MTNEQSPYTAGAIYLGALCVLTVIEAIVIAVIL